MRIAIPIDQGKISAHFGHCSEFYMYDTDKETGEVKGKTSIEAPPHKPGLLPRWLRERGAEVIIAGGMGQKAYSLFEENSIQVFSGVHTDDPDQAVSEYISGTLESGGYLCQH